VAWKKDGSVFFYKAWKSHIGIRGTTSAEQKTPGFESANGRI
jgi:hypothetical protein